MSQIVIACLGSGEGVETDSDYKKMLTVGEMLAQRDCIVITGGGSGIGMEAPARGAQKRGGFTIGVTMLGRPSNRYIAETIDCNNNLMPLGAEQQYGLRLGHLLAASGFVMSSSTGFGTLTELSGVLNLNKKLWAKRQKPIAIICTDETVVAEWEKAIATICSIAKEPLDLSFLKITENPEAAATWVILKAVVIS